MKQISLKPYEANECNCMEGLLVNIIRRFDLNYYFLFADSWRFEYSPSEKNTSVSQKIKTNRLYHLNLLYNVYGINANISEIDNFENLINIINLSIDNNEPVIAYIDAFYCAWIHHAYNCSHITHCIMITGIDTNTKCLKVFDSSPYIPEKTIRFDEFIKMSTNKIMTFNFKERKNISLDEMLIYNLPSTESIMKINYFRDDVLNVDLNKEIRQYKDELFTAPLIIKLQEIGRGRFQYSIFLKKLFEIYGISAFRDCGNRLNVVSKKWFMVRGLFIKTCFKCQSDELLNKIKGILLDILNEEINILKILKSKSSNYIPQDCISNEIPNNSHKYVRVSLEKYFNNKGMGKDGYGEFSVSGGAFCEDLFWDFISSLDNNCFEFFSPQSNFDNIVCESQTIEIPKGYYNTLCFLGASEWGSFIDKLILEYDSVVEEVDINFSDWGSKTADFDNESVFWNGKAIVKDVHKTIVFEANIYKINLKIDSTKELRSIQLPNCENMHIFAMTFYE